MGHKVAIIEDDAAILQMYELKFVGEGYTVKTAKNGLLGLELLNNFDAEIILLDIMMPQMGGVEMLTKLRNTEKHRHTPVIIFTNVGEQEVPKGLNTLDVTEIIAKAYHTPAQVVEKVQKILLSQ